MPRIMASKPEWGWHGAVAEFFSSFVLWWRCELRSRRMRNYRERPIKRLKLAGALVLKEAVVSCPGERGLSFHILAPAGESPAP